MGFQLNKGLLAGLGVAFFFDVRSFAGERDAAAAAGVAVDPNTDLRVWALAGEGEVALGVAAALRPRYGAGEGDCSRRRPSLEATPRVWEFELSRVKRR